MARSTSLVARQGPVFSEQISLSVAFGSKSISGGSPMNCTGSPWDKKSCKAADQANMNELGWSKHHYHERFDGSEIPVAAPPGHKSPWMTNCMQLLLIPFTIWHYVWNVWHLGINCSYKQVNANTYWLVWRILRCHVEGLGLWHHDGSSVCRLVGKKNVHLLSSTKHKFQH